MALLSPPPPPRKQQPKPSSQAQKLVGAPPTFSNMELSPSRMKSAVRHVHQSRGNAKTIKNHNASVAKRLGVEVAVAPKGSGPKWQWRHMASIAWSCWVSSQRCNTKSSTKAGSAVCLARFRAGCPARPEPGGPVPTTNWPSHAWHGAMTRKPSVALNRRPSGTTRTLSSRVTKLCVGEVLLAVALFCPPVAVGEVLLAVATGFFQNFENAGTYPNTGLVKTCVVQDPGRDDAGTCPNKASTRWHTPCRPKLQRWHRPCRPRLQQRWHIPCRPKLHNAGTYPFAQDFKNAGTYPVAQNFKHAGTYPVVQNFKHAGTYPNTDLVKPPVSIQNYPRQFNPKPKVESCSVLGSLGSSGSRLRGGSLGSCILGGSLGGSPGSRLGVVRMSSGVVWGSSGGRPRVVRGSSKALRRSPKSIGVYLGLGWGAGPGRRRGRPCRVMPCRAVLCRACRAVPCCAVPGRQAGPGRTGLSCRRRRLPPPPPRGNNRSNSLQLLHWARGLAARLLAAINPTCACLRRAQ